MTPRTISVCVSGDSEKLGSELVGLLRFAGFSARSSYTNSGALSLQRIRGADYVIWVYSSNYPIEDTQKCLPDDLYRQLTDGGRILYAPAYSEAVFIAHETKRIVLEQEELRKRRAPVALRVAPALPTTTWTPVTFDNELIRSIRSRNCVLYAGAGLSAPAGLPVWADFAQILLRDLASLSIISDEDQKFFLKALNEQKTDYVVDELVERIPTEVLLPRLKTLFLEKTMTPAHAVL
jgi:hypothetical protein